MNQVNAHPPNTPGPAVEWWQSRPWIAPVAVSMALGTVIVVYARTWPDYVVGTVTVLGAGVAAVAADRRTRREE